MLTTAEKYLVESIRKGDQKAFEFLFHNYFPDLCKYARKIVSNETTSEDLVMDVFVKIWEAEARLELTTSLSGYLYTSVHNHCLNYLTRKHKRFTELDQDLIEKLNRLIPISEESAVIENINVAELSLQIEKSIDHLPEECRKIFLMSRTDDLSNKEIAEKLGIAENTVKVQIYRALKKLRILLKDFLP